jgi:hypothetical protein
MGDPPAEVSKLMTTKRAIAPKRRCCLDVNKLLDSEATNREFLNIFKLCYFVINTTANYYKN